MADKPKTADEVNAEQQAEIEAAVTPGKPDVRPGIEKARQAELDRQAEVEAAVAVANKHELPKLGGDLLEPGLGR